MSKIKYHFFSQVICTFLSNVCEVIRTQIPMKLFGPNYLINGAVGPRGARRKITETLKGL